MKVDAFTILFPALVAVMSTILVSASLSWIGVVGGFSVQIGFPGVVLALYLGLQEYFSFLCIQEGRWRELVVVRVFQMALSLFVIPYIYFISAVDIDLSILYFGLSFILPIVGWIGYRVIREGGNLIVPNASAHEIYSASVRSFGLTFSQIVSSLYVNIASILAISLLPAATAGDFSFLSRFATAPVGLLRQVFGQLFLADCLKLEKDGMLRSDKIEKLMHKAVVPSLLFYLSYTALFSLCLFIWQEVLNVSNYHLIFPLFLAGITQLVASQIGLVRVILREEFLFLVAEVLRVICIVFILLFISGIDYGYRYGFGSSLVYGSYILFTIWRVREKFGKYIY
ncbi:hypothetical protein [Sulfitobacter sp. CW3]|uniref:hypothetical protein n=1 Tax=Sulfitobacter sp. CW3 TaxID=2861965 RepID=UPI001C5D0BA9|nr:hypothetical protein [Sulfitobacter sp. CW3]MBW4964189.1 hypothetical protein [Sulfitobacter sp. CW3]